MINATHTPVLIVDDDPVFRESLHIILGQVKDEWDVQDACTVKEALALLSQQSFKLLLLDVHLPDGTVVDIIRSAGTTPCLLCTQDANEPTFRKIFDDPSIAQNIVGYLSKPLQNGVIWSIRAGLEIGRERHARNRLVADATAALENERQMIAQNLHDSMGASLTQLTWIFANIAKAIDAASLDDAARANIGAICAKGAAIVKEAHIEASRVVTQLRPDVVDVAGLRVAIDYLIGQWKASAPTVDFTCNASPEIDQIDTRIAGIVYRLVQEGVTNAMRHSEPHAMLVELHCREKFLHVEIASRGRILQQKEEGVYELTVLRERTSSLGGNLQFTCDAARQESRLLVAIPI